MKVVVVFILALLVCGCALTFYSQDALKEKVERMDPEKKKRLEKKYMADAMEDMNELRLEMAAQKLEIVRELNAENTKAVRYLVRIYRSVKLNRAAIRVLHELLKIAPDDTWALAMLGIIYIDLDRYAEAASYFLKVIPRRSNYIEAYYYLGVIYKKQSNNELARNYFEQFIEKSKSPVNLNKERSEQIGRFLGKVKIALEEMQD